MNIFTTYDCPKLSALALCDRRVNKMIVESAQMLCTNVRMMGISDEPVLYKSAFHNHPCTVWARSTQSNFLWLVDHALHLANVYSSVYDKQHKTVPVIHKAASYHQLFVDGPLEEFANCSLVKRTDVSVTESYRRTMNIKWAKDNQRPTWRNRNKPDWYENLG